MALLAAVISKSGIANAKVARGSILLSVVLFSNDQVIIEPDSTLLEPKPI